METENTVICKKRLPTEAFAHKVIAVDCISPYLPGMCVSSSVDSDIKHGWALVEPQGNDVAGSSDSYRLESGSVEQSGYSVHSAMSSSDSPGSSRGKGKTPRRFNNSVKRGNDSEGAELGEMSFVGMG